jgi:hypothetical protein
VENAVFLRPIPRPNLVTTVWGVRTCKTAVDRRMIKMYHICQSISTHSWKHDYVDISIRYVCILWIVCRMNYSDCSVRDGELKQVTENNYCTITLPYNFNETNLFELFVKHIQLLPTFICYSCIMIIQNGINKTK